MNSSSTKTILLVEDEAIIAAATALKITSFGYKILTASSAQKAIDATLQHPEVSLVLMDIDLGIGIDGTEAAKRILAHRALPIVFLTSHAEREMVEKVRGITRYGYVIKDSGDFVLQSSIEMALELFNASQQLQRELTERQKAEEALNESQEKYRLIAENSEDWIYWIDHIGKIKYSSPSGERLTGYTHADFINDANLFHTIVHPDDRAAMEIHSETARNQQVAGNIDYRIVTKNGQIRWIYHSCSPMYSVDGAYEGRKATNRDITERKLATEELQKSEQRFRASLDVSPIPIAINDEQMNITFLNPSFTRTFGYTMDDIRTVHDWWPLAYPDPEYRARVMKTWGEEIDRIRTTGTSFVPMEASIQCKDGSKKTILISVAPLSERFEESLFAVFVDITDRQKTERQLAQTKRLYATLSEVNQTIVRVRDREELFRKICAIALQFGGFSVAWIGLLDEATGDVAPVATAGLDGQPWPFHIVNINKGPTTGSLTATAIRTGKVATSPDIQLTMAAERILEQIRGYNFHSAAAIPIKQQGKTIGTVTLISAERDFFASGEEVRLLEEMGLDISFALDTMETERTKQLWVNAFEHCGHGLSIGLPGVERLLTCNSAFAQLHGSTVQALTSKPIAELYAPEERPRIAAMIAHADLTGKAHFETRKTREDGTSYDVEMDLVTVFDDNRKVLYRVATQQDITARKAAEARMVVSEKNLQLFVEFAPAAIAMFDTHMRYIALSRRFAADYGITNQPILGRSHYDVFPEISERWKAVHRRCLAGATEREDEDPFPRADGSLDWIRWEIHPWYEKPGVIGGILLFSEVVTERKQRSLALQESESRYRSLIESSNSVIATIDRDGVFQFVNTIAATQLGFSPSDIIGKNMSELFPPDVAESQLARIREVIDTNTGHVDESPSIVNGKQRWYLNNIQPIRDASGKAVLAVLNAQEITNRKEAEHALRESEGKYRVLSEAIREVIWTVDTETMRFLYLSPSVQRLRGFTPEEIMTSSVDKALTKESRKVLDGLLAGRIAAFRSGTVPPDHFYVDEMEQPCKDGSTIWTEVVTSYYLNPATGHVEVRGVTHDITERRKAEETLHNERQLLRTLVDNLPDAIYSKDLQCRKTLANVAEVRIMGAASEADVIGKDDYAVYPKDLADGFYAEDQVVLTQGIPVLNREGQMTDGAGRSIWLLSSKIPVKNKDGAIIGLVGISRDITEQKKADAEIRNLLAEKELLLREVHHRIKNNMNTIRSLLSLQAAAVSDATARAALQDSEERVQSMMLLYDKLYRSARFDQALVDEYLSTLLDDIIVNFPSTKAVTVEKHLDSFMLDAKRLSSLGMIVNELVTNTMKYAFDQREKGRIVFTIAKHESTVTVTLHDDGIGVPLSFDIRSTPGFGLQLVNMLTQQLSGRIRVQRDDGTTWTLEFDL